MIKQRENRQGSSLSAMGIDGCPGGWFYVGLAREGSASFGRLLQIREVTGLIEPESRVLLDMPMGLKDGGPQGRDCDGRARQLLGRKGASIFPSPVRPALEPASYAEASAVNQACTGKKLSVQSFNIMNKIREVDQFVRDQFVQDRFMESHPELCFLALNRFAPLGFSKKSPQGRAERLEILERHLTGAGDLYDTAAAAWPRNQVAFDDILDAMALAASASLPLIRIPDPPPRDRFGIPMQIVYPRV